MGMWAGDGVGDKPLYPSLLDSKLIDHNWNSNPMLTK